MLKSRFAFIFILPSQPWRRSHPDLVSCRAGADGGGSVVLPGSGGPGGPSGSHGHPPWGV